MLIISFGERNLKMRFAIPWNNTLVLSITNAKFSNCSREMESDINGWFGTWIVTANSNHKFIAGNTDFINRNRAPQAKLFHHLPSTPNPSMS
jgi:hypothetical protein